MVLHLGGGDLPMVGSLFVVRGGGVFEIPGHPAFGVRSEVRSAVPSRAAVWIIGEAWRTGGRAVVGSSVLCGTSGTLEYAGADAG